MRKKSKILALCMEHVCPEVCLFFAENLRGPHLNLDYSSIVTEGIRTLLFFFTNFKKKKTQIQLLANLKTNLAQ